MDEKDALPQQLELLQRQLHTQQEVIQKQEQQLQERHRELNDSVQQHPGDASATLAAPAGSAEVVRTPADDIPHAAPPNVWRVAVKLPPFWADSPKVWFAQVEAQFSLARIPQDRTHQNYVVANEVRDILANPPTANLYEHLKTELIRRLSLSENQKERQLQSAVLAKQSLRSSSATCVLSCATWKSRIPYCEHFGFNDFHRTSRRFCRLSLRYLSTNLLGSNRVIEVSLPQLSPTVQAVAATPNTTELAHRIVDINRQLSTIQ